MSNDNPFLDLPDAPQSKIDFSPAMRTVEDIGLVYPVAEAAAQNATSYVGLPISGLAGLGAILTNKLGLTNADPAQIVSKTQEMLTYQPHTTEGQNLTQVAAYPFRKLSDAADWSGNWVLDKTGSPMLATAANTAVNLGPFAVLGAAKMLKERMPTDKPIPEAAVKAADDIVTTAPDRRAINRGASDRRVDLNYREKIANLTEGQAKAQLATSELTGLPNKRAYADTADTRMPYQSFFDLDNFKQLNDQYTHPGADQILKRVGEIVQEETTGTNVKPYHMSGDEFAMESGTTEELMAVNQKIQQRLAREKFNVTTTDGKVQTKDGVGMSFGIGNSLESADAASLVNKKERAAAGLRTERPPETAQPEPLRNVGAMQTNPETVAAHEFLNPRLDEVPLPNKAVNINFEYIDSADSVKAAMAKTAEMFDTDINGARRGTVSFDQTKAAADTLGISLEDLLKRRKGQAFSDAEGLAARQFLVSSAETLKNLAAKASETGAPEDLFNLQRQIVLHKAIQEQVSGGIAETARALNAMKIVAKSSKARLKAINDILQNNPDLAEAAEKLTTLDTVQGVNKYIAELNKPTFADKALFVWINALLSGPQTHAVNMLSNTLTQLWTLPEHTVAATLGKLHGGEKVYYQETLSKAFGMVQGAQEGLQAAAKTFVTGEPTSLRAKLEFEKQTQAIGGTAGKIIGLPGRALMAEDELFKGMGYRSELNTLAMRQGLDEGLVGKALAQRIVELIANPTEEMHTAALEYADYVTFTKKLGTAGQAVQKFASSHPAVRVIVPFIRTPINILKFAGERTPLAIMSKAVREEIKAGGARRDMALARIATGSAVSAVVAHLAAQGLITGGGPSDPGSRAMLYATGWQPYSVKIGDTYYSYSRTEPLGTLMGVAADYGDIAGHLEDKDADEVAGMIALSVSKNLISKTWLSGMSQLIQAVQDPDRYGARWLQQGAGTLIPTGVAQVARTMDPDLRRTDDLIATLKSRIPGYSETLPPRLNVWGQPIVLQGGWGPDLISPFYTSTNLHDKTSEEMVRLKIDVKQPSDKIGDVKITPEKHNELIRLVGQNEKKALDILVNSPAYANMNDGFRELVIRRMLDNSRKMATEQFFAQNPALFEGKEAAKIQELTK